jgi:hypothetical protein
MSKVLKKLKAIRRAIKNIPSKNIDLGLWVTKFEDEWEDCVMCPAGWITTDVFVGKGLELEECGANEHESNWVINYKRFSGYEALSRFVGITMEEAEELFEPCRGFRGMSTDKEIFLSRIGHLIEIYED